MSELDNLNLDDIQETTIEELQGIDLGSIPTADIETAMPEVTTQIVTPGGQLPTTNFRTAEGRKQIKDYLTNPKTKVTPKYLTRDLIDFPMLNETFMFSETTKDPDIEGLRGMEGYEAASLKTKLKKLENDKVYTEATKIADQYLNSYMLENGKKPTKEEINTFINEVAPTIISEYGQGMSGINEMFTEIPSTMLEESMRNYLIDDDSFNSVENLKGDMKTVLEIAPWFIPLGALGKVGNINKIAAKSPMAAKMIKTLWPGLSRASKTAITFAATGSGKALLEGKDVPEAIKEGVIEGGAAGLFDLGFMAAGGIISGTGKFLGEKILGKNIEKAGAIGNHTVNKILKDPTLAGKTSKSAEEIADVAIDGYKKARTSAGKALGEVEDIIRKSPIKIDNMASRTLADGSRKLGVIPYLNQELDKIGVIVKKQTGKNLIGKKQLISGFDDEGVGIVRVMLETLDKNMTMDQSFKAIGLIDSKLNNVYNTLAAGGRETNIQRVAMNIFNYFKNNVYDMADDIALKNGLIKAKGEYKAVMDAAIGLKKSNPASAVTMMDRSMKRKYRDLFQSFEALDAMMPEGSKFFDDAIRESIGNKASKLATKLGGIDNVITLMAAPVKAAAKESNKKLLTKVATAGEKALITSGAAKKAIGGVGAIAAGLAGMQ